MVGGKIKKKKNLLPCAFRGVSPRDLSPGPDCASPDPRESPKE